MTENLPTGKKPEFVVVGHELCRIQRWHSVEVAVLVDGRKRIVCPIDRKWSSFYVCPECYYYLNHICVYPEYE